MEASHAKLLVGFLSLLMSALLAPSIVSAEWYADLYGGAAFTQDSKYRQIDRGTNITLDSKLKVNDSFIVGGRAGYWFEGLPWYGIGLDVFYFEPTLPAQAASTTATLGAASIVVPNFPWGKSEISTIAIGFDVLRVRLPLLKSENYPHGRLQPYITAGPALFITKAKDAGSAFNPPNQTRTDTSLGLKVGGGVAFHMTRAVALFAEYRFTHFKIDATFQDIPSEQVAQAKFDTHHVIGGISFRFN